MTRQCTVRRHGLSESAARTERANFRSVVGSPDPARSDWKGAFRKELCGVLAFRRSGPAPAGWQTCGKRFRSNTCPHADVRVSLNQGNPSASEVDRSDGLCLRERAELGRARISHLFQSCGICRTIAMQSCDSLPKWPSHLAFRPGT